MRATCFCLRVVACPLVTAVLAVGCGVETPPGPVPTSPLASVTATAPQPEPSPTPSPPVSSPGAVLPSRPPSPANLLRAAAEGDALEAEAQLRAGQLADTRDDQGRTPLIIAAQGGHIAVARLLIEGGADVSARDNAGDTAYYFAALERHPEIVGLLLADGADRVGTRKFGGTPLIAVSERGYSDVVREILKHPGVPIDHVNNLGWTALIEAIILGRGGPDHQEVVRLLVAAGANVDLADGTGARPLRLARSRGYTEIVKILEAAGARE